MLGNVVIEVFLGYELAEEVIYHVLLGLWQGSVPDHSIKL